VYEWDVFVSYRRDQPVYRWVTQVFVPILRERPPETLGRDAKVFLDEQSVDAGTSWPDALEQALVWSRCVLPIFNPSYFQRDWCIAEFATMIAARAGLSQAEAERVRLCGLVHDIGKIGVSEEVLRKPGKLTEDEFRHVAAHPVTGHDILRGIPQMADILPGVLHHHERWDGTGYPGRADVASARGRLEALRGLPLPPTGLAGADIPLFARIVAVADVFDALSSRRAYKDPWPEGKVLQTIRDEAGKAFDPELVEIFTQRFGRVKAAWAKHPEESAPAG